ncbi:MULTISPECIES: NAD(P)-dependent oxidoreductase [Myroides]|uniref:3-phosphoglycerate dehydrogenase n=1 Tax=Myroides albus TaxID=2562892 RepID=A0A6I3LDY5_9FLAO|nr:MULTISPECIES: NAD(P)-dependent oxidoreductase [Myroides]MTG97669.1 3-phosphoglycerate dehydrogenase [Myroides albus]MVX35668.1 3-phosphoglycerate dehydrogenase [Myroides sp. LoEW2-1]UVD78785.1 3-phosphoglycerate dehydrogenase [Myroides albus]
MKILANDGISQEVKLALEKIGYEIVEVRVAHEQLFNYIHKNKIEGLLLQNGTLLNKVMINELKELKVIVYAGTSIELELIDYISSKGIHVVWAEEALANATAEMVFAHLFTGCRLLQESNRNMPLEGDSSFKSLQESYSTGIELAGKTLGIIGMSKAGELVAQKALALGMHVLYCDKDIDSLRADYVLPNNVQFRVELDSSPIEKVVHDAHFLTVHTRHFERYVLNKESFDQAHHLMGVINCAYPEAVNEVALVDMANEERLLFAGVDRFEEEPKPAIQVLMQPAFSLSPNINTSTDVSKMLIWDEIIEKMQLLRN